MPADDVSKLSREHLLRLSKLQGDVIESGLDYERLKWLIAREVHAATRSSGAVVEVLDAGEMVYEAVSGIDESFVGLRIRASSSLSGLAITVGHTLSSVDCRTDPRVDREACERVGMRSMIVTPMVHNGIPNGVLKAFSAQPDFFTEQDAAFMRSLSRVLAAALYHAMRHSETVLFERATRDWLTGLANRGLFEDRARHDMDLTRRNGSDVALFVIDINRFKSINDTYGHKTGDAVLQEAASRIRKCIRQCDTAARIGGDEFALLVTEVDGAARCELVKKRLDEAFMPAFCIDDKMLQVAISSGFALSIESNETFEDLLNKADREMYLEKRSREKDPA